MESSSILKGGRFVGLKKLRVILVLITGFLVMLKGFKKAASFFIIISSRYIIPRLIPSVSAADMVAPSCPTVRVYSSKQEVSLNSVFTGYRFAPISELFP